jgi:predicted O-methyltransferase YrrM
MDQAQLDFLDTLSAFGELNDARETAHERRMLNVARETGRLHGVLGRATRATHVVEVGSSNGYSTIWLADAVRDTGGRVTTLEVNPDKIAHARRNLATAGVAGVVEILAGRAADTLARLDGPLDLVFLDADRGNYLDYLDLVVPRLRVGGLLVADNVTSHAHELGPFLTRVRSHPDLLAVTVPVGKGEEIAVRIR